MASEHNQLSFGTALSKAIAPAFGLGEDQPGVGRISESIQVIADLWRLPEWALLRGEALFARTLSSPAVALRLSGVELVNPAGSRKLLIIDSIFVTSGFAQVQVELGASVAANPVTSGGVPRDTRYPNVGAVSIGRTVTGDFAAGVALPQLSIGTNVFCDWEWVLAPGNKMSLIDVTVNTSFDCSLKWRERSPFPGELQARG